MIAASRLRKGNVVSGHGADWLIPDAIATARSTVASGQVMVRADSGYYRQDVITAAVRAKAWFSVTVPMCLAFNILRAAADVAASVRHAKARWATLRTHLIAVPARIASTARRLVLHLPTKWPWATAWDDLWTVAATS